MHPADMYHRTPVVIFLSDGEDNVSDEAIYVSVAVQ
jgi:hypothetical protein